MNALEELKAAPRSYSQADTYTRCPLSLYLERVAKAWQKPAFWFAQGTAFHATAEADERSGRSLTLEQLREVFVTEYLAEFDRYAAQTPNLEHWFPSGPYKGYEYTNAKGKFQMSDLERRFHIGLTQVNRYHEYYRQEAPHEVIWITPDGTPAIELPFTIDLDGVAVRGVIDQVIHKDDGTAHPRDLKTGREPGGTGQLALYGEAVRSLYGVDVLSGDFWMAPNRDRKGGPTEAYDLTAVSRQELVDHYGAVDEGIKAERFDPKPSEDNCRFCSVKTSCKYAVA